MKWFIYLTILLVALFSSTSLLAQDPMPDDSLQIYIIIKHDRSEFVGQLLFQDAREVLIRTEDLGDVVIPKHEIKTMRPLEKEEIGEKGRYVPKEVFSTRYFLTTNGLPVEAGENYFLMTYYGAEAHFSVGKNLGVGLMSTWLLIPMIGNIKYSIPLSEKVHLGIGGTSRLGTWVQPDFGLMLPFAALTFGDRKTNLNFSVGHGLVFDDGNQAGRTLFSVAGVAKLGRGFSLVLDSFLMPRNNGVQSDAGTGLVIVMPGVRIQNSAKDAFQFGAASITVDGSTFPIAIPMIQWFRSF